MVDKDLEEKVEETPTKENQYEIIPEEETKKRRKEMYDDEEAGIWYRS